MMTSTCLSRVIIKYYRNRQRVSSKQSRKDGVDAEAPEYRLLKRPDSKESAISSTSGGDLSSIEQLSFAMVGLSNAPTATASAPSYDDDEEEGNIGRYRMLNGGVYNMSDKRSLQRQLPF
jgi:hypothetical protein